MCHDNSVVIAGLGLRLAPQPTENVRAACNSKSPDEGRVFVTELVNGGAAQRSNLLKQNDEILHVDHVTTKSRTVNDVKNAILGTPGTSVRIGIRRSGEQFELSFVRGHTQERGAGGSASKQPGSGSKDLSSATKGTPTALVSTGLPSARPTPKALFRASPSGKDAAVHAGTSLAEAARRGDMELVAKLAAEVMALARSGHAHSVRNLVLDDPSSQSARSPSSHPVSRELDLDSDIKFQPHSVCVAHSSAGGAEVSLVPTLQFDGMSPMPAERVSKEREAAARLLAVIEPLMDATANGETPPPTDRDNLRLLVLEVAAAAAAIQVTEPRMLNIPAPCYVLGDIHGNLLDLTFFRRTVWPAGPAAQGGDFLFLGDFVDRGADSLPVVAYMMALKVLHPKKWWMIRGNHETREVNGNVKTYREGSFLHQCLRIFGDLDGRGVWDATNDFFDTLPLAARVGGRVFCVHGGLPKELCQPGARLEDINEIETPLRFVRRGDMVHAMLWSDPVPPEREATPETERQLDAQGFGLSSRGCACFGEKTLEIFMRQHAISYVFRGHEAQQHGIGLSKSTRLCTIFSTSKDHFAPEVKTTCGCVLVSREGILPIIRGEPALRAFRAYSPPPAAPAPAPAQRPALKQLDGNSPQAARTAPGGKVEEADAKPDGLFVC